MTKPAEKLQFVNIPHRSNLTQEEKANQIIQQENDDGYRLVNIERSESSSQGPGGAPNSSSTTILHFRKTSEKPEDQITKVLEENISQMAAELGEIGLKMNR